MESYVKDELGHQAIGWLNYLKLMKVALPHDKSSKIRGIFKRGL